MRDGLIIFAKPPVAGRVKTRLHSMLLPDEAAALYHAFLADALRQFESLEKEVFLFFSGDPDESGPVIDTRAASVHQQEGGDLGTRLRNAFLDVFAEGVERAIVVGTDHPSLPTAFVARAFVALDDRPGIVIGPSRDGGYYLLGMTDLFPVLWENMTFSHDRVFDETLERAFSTRASVSVLPVWYDVDHPEQLPELFADLRSAPDQAPETLRTLEELAEHHEWLR